MSKLSQLKKDAYQAGKKRNWDEAVSLYERILEQDKNNPTVINELGDLCLKAGKTPQAVRYFLSAAAKYRQTGLLNNAVAIYKKILRYEGANLNAHWYLAETRASQGLLVEGENHGLHFLEHSRNLTADIKEIFLKRCLQLFELYPQSQPILERLVQVFRTWDLNLEAARAGCLLACGQWDAGEQDAARSEVETLHERVPELANYPEWTQWQQRVNPDGGSSGSYSDFGAVDLAGQSPAAEETPKPPAAAPDQETNATSPATDGPSRTATPAAEPAPSAGDEPLADEPAPAAEKPAVEEPVIEKPAAEAPTAATPAQDGEGCISIDADGDADLNELLGAAVAGVEQATETEAPENIEADPFAAAPAEPEAPADDDAPVDLLAEILADDSNLLEGGAESQMASITREIGSQLGGDGDEADPSGLYDQGTVYLEMGMYDEACAAFSSAAASGDQSVVLRAREMWAETLQRSNRVDEAVTILRDGLVGMTPGAPEHLGMLYNLGKTCAKAGRNDEAAEVFGGIVEFDENYLDVRDLMSALSTA
ncbi:MAG: tetratricopeptide repeat protein [bacterium]|nr:tetratricopeptide repeat protein [bacterium]